jgi:hypothetical protein
LIQTRASTIIRGSPIKDLRTFEGTQYRIVELPSRRCLTA